MEPQRIYACLYNSTHKWVWICDNNKGIFNAPELNIYECTICGRKCLDRPGGPMLRKPEEYQ